MVSAKIILIIMLPQGPQQLAHEVPRSCSNDAHRSPTAVVARHSNQQMLNKSELVRFTITRYL